MTILVFAEKAVRQWLQDAAVRLTMRYEQDDCEMRTASTAADWTKCLTENAADVVIADVTLPHAIDALCEARQKNAGALILPIADAAIPPSDYVRPEILPYALLWRPIESASNYRTFERVVEKIYGEKNGEKDDRIVVAGRMRTQQIPLSSILYFESREKKVFARLQEQEIAVKDTITNLETQLERRFLRCHKSFLVNRERIQSADWSNQLLYVRRDADVPISRGYRSVVKGALHGIE